MKTLLTILSVVLAILSVVCGILIGVGGFAYGVYLVILMVKGTITVAFWTIFKVVACWLFSGFLGWATFLFLGFLSAVCAAKSFAS